MGLGTSYWTEVLQVLQDIIPIYDRVNSQISLGRDQIHRTRAITGRVDGGNAVLDAGSGFGNMTKTARGVAQDLDIILYDPLIPMLRHAQTTLESGHMSANGVFEHIPFRDCTFDAVLCGYSLRDAISLKVAVSEIYRVLKSGGRLIIVDLGKPDNPVIRAGMAVYLRVVLPIVALSAGGKRGLKFGALYGTFLRWPKNSELRQLLEERFARVEFETDLLGGAVMAAAYK